MEAAGPRTRRQAARGRTAPRLRSAAGRRRTGARTGRQAGLAPCSRMATIRAESSYIALCALSCRLEPAETVRAKPLHNKGSTGTELEGFRAHTKGAHQR